MSSKRFSVAVPRSLIERVPPMTVHAAGGIQPLLRNALQRGLNHPQFQVRLSRPEPRAQKGTREPHMIVHVGCDVAELLRDLIYDTRAPRNIASACRLAIDLGL